MTNASRSQHTLHTRIPLITSADCSEFLWLVEHKEIAHSLTFFHSFVRFLRNKKFRPTETLSNKRIAIPKKSPQYFITFYSLVKISRKLHTSSSRDWNRLAADFYKMHKPYSISRSERSDGDFRCKREKKPWANDEARLNARWHSITFDYRCKCLASELRSNEFRKLITMSAQRHLNGIFRSAINVALLRYFKSFRSLPNELITVI